LVSSGAAAQAGCLSEALKHHGLARGHQEMFHTDQDEPDEMMAAL
jgi:hypothetical protein